MADQRSSSGTPDVLTPPNDRWRLPTTIAALGIVFGDIGTSPLYVLRQVVHVADSAAPEIVLGGLSLLFWSVTLVVTLKYIHLVLRADNDGEGGIVALITLLDLHRARESRRKLLLWIGLIGTGALLADGVITPAISVLSAIEGIEVSLPSLDDWVLPLSALVLVGLFVVQRLGIERIATLTGPLMLAWFMVLAALGMVGIAGEPRVLFALSPLPGLHLIISHAPLAVAIIGAVFLAVTGGEALYADLGQFGRRPIQRAWLWIAMPALLLNYFGQGALLIEDGAAVVNPFYELAPDALRPPLIVLATLATVIASQAVITGAFSLGRQAMELGVLPPARVRHTSSANEHQIYIGRINWLIGGLCLAVMVGFGSSDALGGAYGLAVALAMVTTTILFVAYWRRRMPGRWFVLLGGAALLMLDGVFVIGGVLKIGDGAWFPLLLTALVGIVMLSWRRGSERITAVQLHRSEAAARFAHHRERDPSGVDAVILSRPGPLTPVALVNLTELAKVRFRTIVLVSIWVAARPRVKAADRLRVLELGPGISRVEIRFGYLQKINLPAELGPTLKTLGMTSETLVYIIGHERPVAPQRIKKPADVLAILFVFLARTAERAVDRYGLPRNRTLEIGYAIDV